MSSLYGSFLARGLFARTTASCTIFYRDHRAWEHYIGCFDESIYEEIRDFTMSLEGMFRSFEGQVDRTDTALLQSIEASIAAIAPVAADQTAEERGVKCSKEWIERALLNKGDSKVKSTGK